MNRIDMLMLAIVTAAMVLGSTALAADDKHTSKVPNGLAFSEFKGYENWQLVSVSEDGGKLAALDPLLDIVERRFFQMGLAPGRDDARRGGADPRRGQRHEHQAPRRDIESAENRVARTAHDPGPHKPWPA